ncbi:hypothetical protein LWI28_020449 [Acer negundo]|uniref:Pentatricopeptide repeat-containing protein n=1 Tax=Acer negundo TaxID=4023 RepID=A0AAD5J739_ACENE|nr:hypothetical protein LWI28_020449 [Acer negundo]
MRSSSSIGWRLVVATSELDIPLLLSPPAASALSLLSLTFGSAMWRSPATSYLVSRLTRLSTARVQTLNPSYNAMSQILIPNQTIVKDMSTLEGQCNNQVPNATSVQKHQIGENVARKEKIKFLVTTLLDLKDSKEAVYGALDAWVAWEPNFPIVSLKRALLTLEKEEQWHRIVQVIKWMLSKGQGSTMGTHGQLIRALDKDHRAEEAHKFWVKKIGTDLHSVPWQMCKSMICIYYRNNMLERLVKLFKGLEAYDRKPPEKSIVQKVADAYQMLGLLEEKERVLEKYKDLFTETGKGRHKMSKRALSKNKKNSGHKKDANGTDAVDDIQ